MTTILERLAGITDQQEHEAISKQEEWRELVMQGAYDTAGSDWDEKVAAHGPGAPSRMEEDINRILQREVAAHKVADGDAAIQDRAALAAEEQDAIKRFEELLAEHNSAQLIRNARAQEIESRIFAAQEAKRMLAATYISPEIDETLARCHARVKQIVDAISQLQDSINARNAKLKQSQQSSDPDAKEAMAFSEAKLQEYRAAMSDLTAERQALQKEIDEAELRKLDPLSVVI